MGCQECVDKIRSSFELSNLKVSIKKLITGRSGFTYNCDLIVESPDGESICVCFDKEFDERDVLRMLAIRVDADIVQVIVVDRVKPKILERIKKLDTSIFLLENGKQVIVSVPTRIAENGNMKKIIQKVLEVMQKYND
ncbi:MAG: hypothetical protein J7J67_02540 [Thermoproteales archaeon]|nr:hypothetical protein [Thermoproteales archaeon]